MPLGVTKNNWADAVESTINRVFDAAASVPPGSFDELVLLSEVDLLRKLRTNVRDRIPTEREAVISHLIQVSSREPVNVSRELIEFVGAIFDIYRRWRTQLVWQLTLA